uniref:WAPL domain-containing protein n=1 Tax=Rhabditophanes sp. KR3021 TaxID=114890 RepID=A0AC35UC63_9BILA
MYSSAIIQASASLNQFEESIINALATLKLDVSRNCEPTPKELEKLNELHDGLLILCRKDNDEARKKRCLCVGPIINKFREQAFYMRKRMRTDECPELDSYLNTSQNDITFIVQNSFDENTRKVAILLGAVEVIAELLILNVSLFGMGEDKLENTKVRQYFASALINLSYGNTVTKRKLCFYGHFIHTVTKIISESSALSQVYASLIRNLSWMAEEDMIGRLHETVPALSKAAVRAHIVKDAKTLGATLQALWNLAGHSVNNQKIICEEEGCLDMLISLLSVDPQFSALLETSSGLCNIY